jgi:hypothetical protein
MYMSQLAVAPVTAPPMERAPRTVTTFLVAKLIAWGADAHLCRVRNISATGMMIETYFELACGSRVAVELRGGERLQGLVVWASSGRAGVQFGETIEVDRILAEAKLRMPEPGANAPRAPRFEIGCAARISSYGRSIDVMIENVSQSGARVRLPRPPRPDSEVILMIPGLPPRRCTCRWAADEVAGLAFHDVIPYHELAEWLEHAQPH